MNSETISLSVKLGALELKNPVILASGTAGFGLELARVVDLSALGALVTKTITLEPREGSPAHRLWETPSGMLNAIGLENPGVDRVSADILPRSLELGLPIIPSIGGQTVNEYARVAEKIAQVSGIAALELNLSCPNVERGGMFFGRDADTVAWTVSAVADVCSLPLLVKLTPNVSDVVGPAQAAAEGGASAVVFINTLLAMAVDPGTRRPRLANVTGGLSGPAIRPVAVRIVYEVFKATEVPIVGCGGVGCLDDAVEFLIAGASAVQVGTAGLLDPHTAGRIVSGLPGYLAGQGMNSLQELVGSLLA